MNTFNSLLSICTLKSLRQASVFKFPTLIRNRESGNKKIFDKSIEHLVLKIDIIHIHQTTNMKNKMQSYSEYRNLLMWVLCPRLWYESLFCHLDHCSPSWKIHFWKTGDFVSFDFSRSIVWGTKSVSQVLCLRVEYHSCKILHNTEQSVN